MKKWLVFLGGFLFLVPLLFADVNQGTRTRELELSCTIDSAQTAISYIVFPLQHLAEGGITILALKSDITDTFNVWFSSGVSMRGEVFWSDSVQCVWTEITPKKPINVTFLQNQALTDITKARTGYMAAHYFRVIVKPTGIGMGGKTKFYAKILVK